MATASSSAELILFWLLSRLRLSGLSKPSYQALQGPETYKGLRMASRRLNSDRFLTTDYNEQVYTRMGIEWINDTEMSTVLLRHYPNLAPSLRGVKNAFWPWTRVGS